MHTRRLILVAGLAAAHAMGVTADEAKPAVKPNILLVVADDLGYADAGFNGGRDIRTPNLDRLAGDGAVLTSFYVQPVCSPTRAALMTGRYPTRTGVYTVVRPQARWGLPLAERTLADALRDAGYETAICGKWHLGEFEPAYRPLHRGFDHQYGPWFGAIDYFTHRRDALADWHRDDRPCADEGYSTHLLAKEACRLIRQRRWDRPLFLYLPFNAVHAPHQVPESYTKPYGNLSGVRRTYAGMLSAMDEAVGQVVAALKEKGELDRTLVIFCSDNGGPSPGRVTDNGPLRAGKGTCYEGGVRACAFATWPGHIPAGRRIAEPLHVVDWFPTLVKLAGAPSAQELPPDGRDLWPVLTQGAKSPHEALLLHGTSPGQAAIRAGDWKLLVGANERDAEEEDAKAPARGGGRPRRAAGEQLYDLAADAGERNDLAGSNPAKVRELRGLLDALLKNKAEPGGGR